MIVRVIPTCDSRMILENLEFGGVAFARGNFSKDIVDLRGDVEAVTMDVSGLIQLIGEG